MEIKEFQIMEKKVKETIKNWILEVNKQEFLPKEITALNFGLFEPYGIELIGSKCYDPNDDDWACEEDFEPLQRVCPELNISLNMDWEDVLDMIVKILKELLLELENIEILKVEHITTGFCDGDLVIIK